MLACLRVRHFAIIEALEIEFDRGMQVVTGETGAGKSIVVDALQLVLGGRASPEAVRAGAEQAVIEALFVVSAQSPLAQRCKERDLLAETAGNAELEIVLRRVVPRQGRSRAYVNGQLITGSELAELTRGIVDISSQHEHHNLVEASSHLRFLDAFAGLEEAREASAAAYETVMQGQRRLATLREQLHQRQQREELLRFQLAELEAAATQPGEDESLQAERSKLRHAEKLMAVTARAESALYADDDALCSLLGKVASEVRQVTQIDPSLQPLLEQLDSTMNQLQETARELGAYARSVSLDSERLHEVDERLEKIERLKRKHGGSLAAACAYQQSATHELQELQHVGDRLQEAERDYEAALTSVTRQARALRSSRQQAASELSRRITEELASLGMGEARVEVALSALEGRGEQAIEVDGARLSPLGIDRAEFLIAPNRGEQARPLGKIASGGELSRALLAIKRVLAAIGPASIYIFDEVDAGVGGAIAEVIGRKLRDVAQHHQVICITHLAQIAVHATAHYRVHKEIVDDRTHSTIARLHEKERLQEVARMLGGLKVSPQTRAAAAELLREAQQL